jgi:hypothetical protein
VKENIRRKPKDFWFFKDNCCKQAISPPIAKTGIVGENAIFRQLSRGITLRRKVGAFEEGTIVE